MAEKKDFYEVLGVDRNASDDTIKSEYRKKAKKYHPDLNPNDPTAEAKFKELGDAYEVLSDREKRARYDQFGHAGVDPSYGAGQGYGFGGFGNDIDLGDILDSMFGGFGFGGQRRSSGNPNAPRRGGDVHYSITLDFMEAVHGCNKTLNVDVNDTCKACHGTGAEPPTMPEVCSQCHGTGYVTMQQSMLGAVYKTSKPCPSCGGKGKTVEKPCRSCGGEGMVRERRRMDVKIPAGINTDQSLRLAGRGDAGINGGSNGNVVITINVKPDMVFERQNNDIYIKVPIGFAQAALGDEITIPTIDGKINLKVPPGTQSDTVFKLDKRGVPFVNRAGRGSQFVTVQVEVPKKLNREQKQLLQQFDENVSIEKNYERRKGFYDRVHRMFR